MTTIIGLSGSLRKGSYNTALLAVAKTLAPAGVTLDVRTLHGIPLYDGDVEASDGIPDAVSALKDAIANADGLLLATPEYNNGMPGVFKNALDWLSRPPADSARVFQSKPVAIMGASPGGFGTILSQNAWLPVLRTLQTTPWWQGRLMVSHANKVFDGDGNLQDDAVRQQLAAFVAGFVAFLKEQKSGG
ncbi:NADPH-dependent FMN reductase [Pandoraea apista]|uniref:NADPH-dependent FMN reductase n=1 Tax=Pandoraea apista TaxID=93218 RepID=UPI00058A9047|nr:NADPH-dependent FMN reductase [Pandoraea apista]AJF00088.1 NADPH-dependent FMN reductase [Pandoraea apista]AKH74240.1 NADPH-dependent FMN reductase [Pandoraea apista]AKI62789.1 NADPH-dependent FMN reductase [Pandoraea apista]